MASPYAQALAGGYQQALAGQQSVGCGCSGGWTRSGYGTDAVPVPVESGPFGLSSSQALGLLALGAVTLGAFVYLGRD